MIENRRRILIYVAGKYTGPERDENIKLAKEYAIKLWEAGYTVICPHLNTANFENESTCSYMDFLGGCFTLISASNALLMLPNWRDSNGAIAEKLFADQKYKQVFYSIEGINNYYDRDDVGDDSNGRIER